MTGGETSLTVLVGLAEEAELLRDASRSWPKPPHILVGGGTTAAAERRAPGLLTEHPTSLLSFGYCGGLSSDLKPGDLVVATEVIGQSDRRFSCDPALSRGLVESAEALELTVRSGTLATPAEAAATPAAKRRLADTTGALAVDLESAALAEVAVEANLPFAVIRAVLDDLGTTLPPFAIAAVDETSGRPRMTRLLLGLLRSPGDLPALVRLGRARAAAQASLRRLLVRPLTA
ncbi:phosphorylase family protein [Algihabitans albus]|uniref:phosphorylase family protein n=1 Tax=Algihabitans albus TaxID=2164067 RepID=UPI000E5CB1FB|nr:hypothetical protein [Algihabitans albus]